MPANTTELEKRLWGAADELRANSKLKSSEYSVPIPLAVLPEFQRQGIGSELVRRGLETCRERSKGIVLVLGDPTLYTRFGFSVESARWLQSPYSGDHWMALELVPGAVEGVRGVVRFPAAFNVLL
jgi:putative acetyltransferase